MLSMHRSRMTSMRATTAVRHVFEVILITRSDLRLLEDMDTTMQSAKMSNEYSTALTGAMRKNANITSRPPSSINFAALESERIVRY